MDIAEASRILLSKSKIDESRIVSHHIENIKDLLTIDKVIKQIEQYETRLSNGHIVGVAEIQTARGGRYWIDTADEATPGKKIGDWDRYVKFWPKSYFLDFRQRLLRTQDYT